MGRNIGIQYKIHPELHKYLEKERKKLCLKGVYPTQAQLTKMIAQKLNRKQRGLGLLKNAKKNRKTKKK